MTVEEAHFASDRNIRPELWMGEPATIAEHTAPTKFGPDKALERRELRGMVLDGTYRLDSLVDAGGMGEIWAASDLKLDRQLLVKLLPPEFSLDGAYIDALLREAKVTAGLPGGHFPAVMNCGVSGGIAYYVMESLDGVDLGRLLEHQYPGGMSAKEAIPLIENLLEALSAAHEAGVIHRDIKPSNIFVETIADGGSRVRILDFGVAKVQSEVHATIAQKLPRGTKQFMPPETFAPIPDVTAASDVFAVGITAYQMILGRHPFASGDYLRRYKSGDELSALHQDRAGQRAGVTAAVADVLLTAVHFDPQSRFVDAGTMLKALRGATEFRPRNISIGTVVADSYRVLGKLGEGAMGAVYDVEDTHRQVEGRQVLKILVAPPRSSEERIQTLRERFRRECGVLHELQHEAIPYIYENASHLGVPFLVMAHAKGKTFDRSFHELLANGGWEAVVTMARQVASALDAVHGQGIIHRDIKPSNIIVDPETAKAVVLDFGIARLHGTELTASDVRIGTPGFSSPEQIWATPVPASDQWSFAACLYTMLTGMMPGSKPGEADSVEPVELSWIVDERIGEGDVLPLCDCKTLVEVPAAVEEAIDKAMSQDVDDRFATVSAFVDALAGAKPRPSSVSCVKSEAASKPKVARLPYLRISLSLILGVAALGAGYTQWDQATVAPVSGPPSSAGVSDEAPVPLAEVIEPAMDAGVQLVDVVVYTTHWNQRIDGLKIQSSENDERTPFTAQLPIGENVFHLEQRRYRGDYSCLVTIDTLLCELKLKRRKPEHSRSVHKRPVHDSDLFYIVGQDASVN